MTLVNICIACLTILSGAPPADSDHDSSLARKWAEEVAVGTQAGNLEIDPTNARLVVLSQGDDDTLPTSFALFIPARARRAPVGVVDAEDSSFRGIIVFRSCQPAGTHGELETLADLPDDSVLAGCVMGKVFVHRSAARRQSLEITGARNESAVRADAYPLSDRRMNVVEFNDGILALQLDRACVAFFSLAKQSPERKGS